MNSPSSNSGSFANPAPPPPVVEVFVQLPDGSCIPATAKMLKIVLRQARSEATKQRRLKAKEKAVELQCALEDRAAARSLLRELAEIDLERRRMAATLRAKVRVDRPARDTSDVVKRTMVTPARRPIAMTPLPSSWVVDDFGMRGVHYSQSYIGRKSPGFYRGAARDRWEYEARDEAVLRDDRGNPVIIANIGEDIDEIGAAWQAIEDATTRKNGKIQIRIIVAFDADASEAENVAALTHFCETVLAPLGLPYSAVIHRPPAEGDQRNRHAHILTNLRPTQRIEPYCWAFADHVRGELDGRDGVQLLRHLWAHALSEAAQGVGREMLYTGLSYGARGLDLEAGEHLQEARSAMVRRGTQVWAYERNRIKSARNAARMAIRDADRKIEALTKLRDAIVAQAETEPDTGAAAQALASTRVASAQAMPLEVSRASVTDNRPVRLSVSPIAGTLRSITRAEPARPSSVARPGRSSVVPPAPGVTAGTSVAPEPLVAATPPPGPRRSTAASLAVAPVRWPTAQTADATRSVLVPSVRPDRPARLSASSTIAAGDNRPRLVPAGIHRDTDSRVARARIMRDAIADWLATQTDKGLERSVMDQPAPVDQKPSPVGKSSETPAPDGARASMPPWLRRRTVGAGRRGTIDGIDAIPTREWLEDHPMRTYDEAAARDVQRDRALIERLRRGDAYVMDYGAGWFDVDPRVANELKVDDAWFQEPHVQRALTAMRAEQQAAIDRLRADAAARPLAYSKTSQRFWPNDLEPALKRRLDCWVRHEGFGQDVLSIERAVRRAHEEHETAERQRRAATAPAVKTDPSGTVAKRRVGDDLRLEGARIRAFAANTGRPTRPLLMLLRYAGEHPDRITVPRGVMQVSDDAPALIRALVAGWRSDPTVRQLVATTVNLSRAAGRPVWPPDLAYEMRAIVSRTPVPSWSAQELGLSR